MSFCCEICGYKSNLKTNLERHLGTKKHKVMAGETLEPVTPEPRIQPWEIEKMKLIMEYEMKIMELKLAFEREKHELLMSV
jgi:hypothetical protein